MREIELFVVAPVAVLGQLVAQFGISLQDTDAFGQCIWVFALAQVEMLTMLEDLAHCRGVTGNHRFCCGQPFEDLIVNCHI